MTIKKTLLNPQKNILKFWRDIEIFNLPDLSENVYLIDKNTHLPWTLEQQPLEDAKRQYILYFGKQQKIDVVKIIEEQTGETDQKPDWLEKVTGNTCMAVLILEENGQISDDGAYVQASYLHGLKSLQDQLPLDKVSEKLEKVQEDFQERMKENVFSQDPKTSPQNEPLTWKELQREINMLQNLKIKGIECNEKIYCQSIIISKKIKNTDTSFLNSFYLQDLGNLIKNEKSWNSGLKTYLKQNIQTANRNDLLKEVDNFFKTIDPAIMPMGRWPSDPAFGAYCAQLGAMSTALSELKSGGIIGINGPPGTGKTTLLSDIISDIIVQRAKRLIDANNILMFTRGERIQRESDFLTHFPIKEPIFEDAGIVVASNNNAAVENISKELPDRDKIHHSFENTGYFSDHTTSLIEKESWGLLAVALGNSENRGHFKSNFWYNSKDKTRFSQYLKSLYNNPEDIDHTLTYRSKFEKCKIELNQLIAEFETFRETASKFHSMLSKQLLDLDSKLILENKIDKLNNEAEDIQVFLAKKTEEVTALNNDQKDTKELISLHQLGKPSFFFFQKLFDTKKFKNWNGPLQQYLQTLNNISQQILTTKKELQELKGKLENNRSQSKKFLSELEIIQGRINTYANNKKYLQDTYGIKYENLPDENLYKAFKDNKETFHKSNPWSSEKVNKLRSNILLKSLEIHELAVHANAKQFRNNVNILLEMLDGKATVSNKIATSVWKTFFFLVPVVSTSLASVGRLFRNLDEDSIGWLMLDEAGQASIQSAAGIINRSKRSIIIGDPLQIEPVITIPAKLIEILNRPYKNESIWSPRITSAQQLADRITNKGTEMKLSNDEKIWTGFPLRTHRRCADPMFSIANHIAYSDQMVKAILEDATPSPLGPSSWFHVNGENVENKQIIREEIELLKEKMAKIGKEKNVFVISPFKSVADRCRMEMQRNFPNVKCGTIHTFQGKEADIVILVLGSDPKSDGARAWASRKPNMLNVALTRAKKYFYVIGNRTLWQSCANFDYLSAKLP